MEAVQWEALKAWVVVAAGLRSRGRLLQSSGRRVHESASLFVRGAGAEKKAKDPQHISAAARLWSQRQIRDKIYRRVKKILNWILRLAAAKRKSDVNSCFCSSYRTKRSSLKKLTNIKSDPTSSRPVLKIWNFIHSRTFARLLKEESVAAAQTERRNLAAKIWLFEYLFHLNWFNLYQNIMLRLSDSLNTAEH